MTWDPSVTDHYAGLRALVVQLFMPGWIPSKVFGDRDFFERLPSALDAWLRFAGRKSKSRDWAVAATRAAIPRWRDVMVHRGNGPTAGGPAKQFVSAARRVGVDIEDGDALNSFIAGGPALPSPRIRVMATTFAGTQPYRTRSGGSGRDTMTAARGAPTVLSQLRAAG